MSARSQKIVTRPVPPAVAAQPPVAGVPASSTPGLPTTRDDAAVARGNLLLVANRDMLAALNLVCLAIAADGLPEGWGHVFDTVQAAIASGKAVL